MSVWASAVISHPWAEFSEDIIQRISWAATGARTAPKWFGDPDFKSAQENFNTYGSVSFFLPQQYSLLISRTLMELTLATSWKAILMHKGERKQFLLGCKAVAQLAGADELIVLPDGTVMEDLIRECAKYNEFKHATEEKLGPPDLDIHKIYSEREIRELRQKRIHYFLVKTTDV